ncbi:hypothetical protein BGZ49_002258 [Haplosporangium sp. Z 27]|nr:hypothetical protein BGZ49_002258 [Haplosporangium sp. Z 27]
MDLSSFSESPVPLTKDRIPAILKSIKPDTKRTVDRLANGESKSTHTRHRPRALKSTTSPLSSISSDDTDTDPDVSYTSTSDEEQKRIWGKRTDARIIELFNKGVPWKDIDTHLNRPFSSCYQRYYTALDPNLKLWNLPNGQPDLDMLKRLVYLVEVEQQPYTLIDKQELMKKPWQTPTRFAPREILEAAAAEAAKNKDGKEKEKPMDRATKQRLRREAYKQSKFNNSAFAPLREYNKLTLQKKYEDYKALLAKNAILLNRSLLHRAIRRGVELYGENWKKVAVHADMLLDEWTPSKAAQLDETIAQVIKATNASEGSEESEGLKGSKVPESASASEGIKDHTPEEREPLTPNKVASIYRLLARRGVSWGLEDDVVMTRKILNLYQTDPNILEILAKPLEGNVRDRENGNGASYQSQAPIHSLQKNYWREISIALGNHSPLQCKRRWDGLWSTKDDEKSAQSRSWHRFERFNFWMLWKHFYQQRHQSLGDNGRVYDLTSYQGMEDVYQELSFVKDISKWMRHRNEAQCEKYFKSVINSVVRHGQSVAEQGTRNQEEIAKNRGIVVAKEMEPVTSEFLLRSIYTHVAEPLLDKMSNIYTRTEPSTANDPHQPIVRPDWTPERIKMLYDIVMKEKQGVSKGDFELNWDRIAYRLEKRIDLLDTIKDTDDNETMIAVSSPKELVESQRKYGTLYVAPEHCQECWEYLTSPASAEAGSALRFASQSRIGSKSDAQRQHSSFDDDDRDRVDELQDWSDHELQLLQQGIRKYGNSWADIRAQFLPNRNITELYQTWLSIAAPAKVETVGITSRGEGHRASGSSLNEGVKRKRLQIDRLQDPEYMGLLSALDRVGGKKVDQD